MQVWGHNAWDVGNMLQDATSWMENDEYLQKMIQSTCSTCAWWLKMAWDVKNWDQKSTKVSKTQKFINVLDFHESILIHGR